MTQQKLIEQAWNKIEAEADFCCKDHAALYRGMYFSGAMAAMNALTGWNPSEPNILSISMADIAAVRDELTLVYLTEVSEGCEAAGVRH